MELSPYERRGLPSKKNRYLTPKFISGATLATVIAGSAWYGPIYLVLRFAKPADFWQRLAIMVFGSIPVLIWTLSCGFLWIWIASKFE